MNADAIVLPANTRLKEGSGTSKAIYEKAGRAQLEKACSQFLKKYKHVYVGEAIVTPGFNLDAKYIIHAILPKWIDGEHDEYALLSTAYLSSLYWADTIGCESAAFPLLASGNNKFDLELAFGIAKESIEAFEPKNKLTKVYLVLYGSKSVALAREDGYEVDEKIDSGYVLQNDESYYSNIQKTIDKVKEVMTKYSKLFAEDIEKMVSEYLDDEEKRKELIEKGAEISMKVLKKLV